MNAVFLPAVTEHSASNFYCLSTLPSYLNHDWTQCAGCDTPMLIYTHTVNFRNPTVYFQELWNTELKEFK